MEFGIFFVNCYMPIFKKYKSVQYLHPSQLYDIFILYNNKEISKLTSIRLIEYFTLRQRQVLYIKDEEDFLKKKKEFDSFDSSL